MPWTPLGEFTSKQLTAGTGHPHRRLKLEKLWSDWSLLRRVTVTDFLTLEDNGKLRSARDGQRIELSSLHKDRFRFFSGHATETVPGHIETGYLGFIDDGAAVQEPALKLQSPTTTCCSWIKIAPHDIRFKICGSEVFHLDGDGFDFHGYELNNLILYLDDLTDVALTQNTYSTTAPTVRSLVVSSDSGVTHQVTMPATVSAGDLLLMVVFAQSDGIYPTCPDGWIDLEGGMYADMYSGSFCKKADGTEDGTTVDVTWDASMSATYFTLAIQDAADPTVRPPETDGAGYYGYSPNPPSISPVGGELHYMAIASAKVYSTSYLDGWCSYTDNRTGYPVGGYPNIRLCTQAVTSATIDPSSFSQDDYVWWLADTWVIYPALLGYADNDLLAYDSASELWINQTAAQANLQTLVSGATADNFASFNAAGQVKDSGSKASDFAGGAHNHDASYISVIAAPADNHFPYQTATGELDDSGYDASDFATDDHNHDSDYISVIGTPAENHFPYQTAGGELIDSTYDAADFSAAGHDHDSDYADISHGHALDDISDVAAASPDDGDVLTWVAGSPGSWQPAVPAGGSMALDNLTDVNAAAPSNAQVLTWDSVAGEWQAEDVPAGGSHALDDHTDVNAAAPTDQDVLTWDNDTSMWIPQAAGSGPHALDAGQTDVTITSVADNEVLAYDSGTSEWINQTAAEAGLATSGHDHDSDYMDIAAALDDISDVDAAAPSDGDVLTWVDANNAWEPAAPAGGAVTTTRTLVYSVPVLAVSTGVMKFMLPYALTIVSCRALVGTAPTGASLIVDVNKDGTTIYSTQANRPTITTGNTDSGSWSAPDVTSFSANSYFTVDIDQVGSTIVGANLTVMIKYTVTEA